MATPTREEQEDSFARQVYEAARAAGFAAQDQGSWVLRVRFLDKDEVGIGKELLCATSLDWKSTSPQQRPQLRASSAPACAASASYAARKACQSGPPGRGTYGSLHHTASVVSTSRPS